MRARAISRGTVGAACLTVLVLTGCGGGDVTGREPARTDSVVVTTASTPVAASGPEGPAATTASPSDAPTDPPPREVSERSGLYPLTDADLVALTSRMSTVLEDGTEDEWAALFELPEGELEQWRLWFRSVREVPMSVRLFLPDVVAVADSPEGGRGDVIFAHQVEGADPVPAVQGYRLTVEQRPGEDPVITGTSETGGNDGHPQLWDLAAVDVTETQRLLVLAPKGRGADVAAVLPGLETAAANAFGDFAADDRERLVVQLATSEQIEAIMDDKRTGTTLGLATYLSGVDPDQIEPEQVNVTLAADHLDRIVIDLDVLVDDLAQHGFIPPGGWSVMRHEGVHALLDGDPTVSPPVWLWEGLAQWYGDRRDYEVDSWYAEVVARTGVPEELPSTWDEYYYEGDETGEVAYAVSAMVFTYLDRGWGFETARDVGVGLSSADSWYDHDDLDAVFEEETGMTYAEFEDSWREWVAANYG
ncbi:hypothetical protein [Ornithinimicrobium tianjinense]|uniref:Peptidase MA superfamily protein n=1 Tax=Ornithinimicrobium tianjinense TaxID=1195761 RepID=A0A917BSB1_9MICO|nr:hypothetical protein [Ornithinimicrobium tianjinense]GGF57117.1 hypothetical protein GCM10011366_26210 [Ornithinimicrobium tianjinense]